MIPSAAFLALALALEPITPEAAAPAAEGPGSVERPRPDTAPARDAGASPVTSVTPEPGSETQPGATGAPSSSVPAPERAPPPDEEALEPFRVPVELLVERMVGSASRAVRFDWRKKTAAAGLVGSQLLELNNFTSSRAGVFARMPLGGFLGEVAVSRVWTWGSLSTERLALTPYRQVARPSRFELDLNLMYPLAEGVATARPGFLPATELVFSAVGGVRYLYYPGSLRGLGLLRATGMLALPQLSQEEIDNLETARLPAMEIDRGRYGVLAGLALDVYFPPGLFVSPRVMIAPPLLSAGPGLGFWWELNVAAGWMF